jgi:hypothetical protein
MKMSLCASEPAVATSVSSTRPQERDNGSHGFQHTLTGRWTGWLAEADGRHIGRRESPMPRHEDWYPSWRVSLVGVFVVVLETSLVFVLVRMDLLTVLVVVVVCTCMGMILVVPPVWAVVRRAGLACAGLSRDDGSTVRTARAGQSRPQGSTDVHGRAYPVHRRGDTRMRR